MSDKIREEFEAWAASQNFLTPHSMCDEKQAAWEAWSIQAARIRQLEEALSMLLHHFPTDFDLVTAMWTRTEIDAACDAYEKASAALKEQS